MTEHRLACLLRHLDGDETDVAALLLERLDSGRSTYGVLDVDDGRDWLDEALYEMLDGSIYMACEIVRLRRRLRKEEPCESSE